MKRKGVGAAALFLVLLSGCSALREKLIPADFVRAQYFKGTACGGDGDEMVRVGNVCVDRFEASLWNAKDGGTQIISTSGAVPCAASANDCWGVAYAQSRPNVLPAINVTWFQAAIACANSGKRLLTNLEWQQAAIGTPDRAGVCNVEGTAARATGRNQCVSPYGVFDMVGNVSEWVAEWMQTNTRNNGGDVTSPEYGSDNVLGIDEAAPESVRFPAALMRGGSWRDKSGAGVYALDAQNGPTRTREWIGFRCGR
jgi:formylglycine-generating enzyme required for sulfatase activity